MPIGLLESKYFKTKRRESKPFLKLILHKCSRQQKFTLNFDAGTQGVPSGAPDVLLHRLPEFIRLFLSDGLLPDLVYALELKTV